MFCVNYWAYFRNVTQNNSNNKWLHSAWWNRKWWNANSFSGYGLQKYLAFAAHYLWRTIFLIMAFWTISSNNSFKTSISSRNEASDGLDKWVVIIHSTDLLIHGRASSTDSFRNETLLGYALPLFQYFLSRKKNRQNNWVSLNCKVLIIINSLFISWTIVGFL